MQFKLTSEFQPTGDQPEAIRQLIQGLQSCLLYTSPSPRDA